MTPFVPCLRPRNSILFSREYYATRDPWDHVVRSQGDHRNELVIPLDASALSRDLERGDPDPEMRNVVVTPNGVCWMYWRAR